MSSIEFFSTEVNFESGRLIERIRSREFVVIATSICCCGTVRLQRDDIGAAVSLSHECIIFAMDGHFHPGDLEALQKLICPPKDDSDVEDDLPQAGARKLGPGDIGASSEPSSQDRVGPHAPLQGAGDDIWHPSEAVDTRGSQDHDPRKMPEYEMKFKQAVTAEDVYLGIGFKTPCTASCEWLSLLVKLPGETREEVELSVESEAIDVRSPRYRLHLPTPHPVDPNASSAKWHGDTATLEVTLRLARELDNVNF
ncbi:dynein assembly factor 6, axonemal [Monomorium pharaonis]|uniref:dynein assembly factor 6, axonemal n=1 Tax=Monomorium pharaonis TaxID=307658 RepID=UPI00102E1E46|nr:dynein assembly factor 6, axonemal [Monomorium pharaonis]XP_036138882.1 dynein assembly factor 6, axonemal [Monomorium pharaonis]